MDYRKKFAVEAGERPRLHCSLAGLAPERLIACRRHYAACVLPSKVTKW